MKNVYRYEDECRKLNTEVKELRRDMTNRLYETATSSTSRYVSIIITYLLFSFFIKKVVLSRICTLNFCFFSVRALSTSMTVNTHVFYSTAVQTGNNVCRCVKFDIIMRLMKDEEDDQDV